MRKGATIIHVPASAGSGKTYRLSSRYLQKAGELAESSGANRGTGLGRGCMVAEAGAGPASLLAITFTNKAAAEMKERILLFLKKLAFGDQGITREHFRPLDDQQAALSLLIDVVMDFSRFHVKTIDSFMTTLLKAFSADLGLLPDFRLLLAGDELYDLAVSDLFEHGNAHLEPLRELIEREVKRAAANPSRRSDGKGFDPERIVRKALRRLRRIGDRALVRQVSRFGAFDMVTARKKLTEEIGAFVDRLLQAADGGLNRSRVRSNHGEKAKRGELPKWFTDGTTLASLQKKGADVPGIQGFQQELDHLRDRWRDLVVREAVEQLRSGVAVYQAVLDREDEMGRVLKRFHIGRMTDTIRGILKEKGAPLAFCRLGERYAHYLIDEFQDTSRDQWNALAPLLENSLSGGGSLFMVGDRKQAIYGWRGGDYRLFDEVLLRPEDPDRPADIEPVTGPVAPDAIRKQPLGTNRRSARTIVEWNNRLFRGLKENAVPLPVRGEVLQGVYQDVDQEVWRRESGYVCVKGLEGRNRQEMRPDVQTWLHGVLLQEGSLRFNPQDVLILVRRKEDVRTLAAWFTEWGLPFVTEDSLRLFSRPVVKGLVTLMSALNRADGDHYLAALLASGWLGRLDAGKGEATVAAWSRSARDAERQGLTPVPFREWLADHGTGDIHRELARAEAVTTLGSAYEQMAELIRVLELDRGPDRIFLDQLLEVVLGLEDEGIVDPGAVLDALYRQLGGLSLTLPETPGSVRIMTIHKAKGLEAPVVILPFLDWELTHDDSVIVPYELDGRACLVPVSKQVAKVNEELAAYWRTEREREVIESINLLYVAMTRARDALYMVCPVSSASKNGAKTIGDVLHALLAYRGVSLTVNEERQWGDPPEPVPKPEKPASEPQPVPRRRPVDLLVVQDRPTLPLEEAAARFRGTLLHRAMQEIRVLPARSDVEPKVKRALRCACAALGVDWSRVLEAEEAPRLAAVIRKLERWFLAPVRAWNEKEFVGRKGAIIRVDRLAVCNKEMAIIDYKTGHSDPSHREQVQRYRRILGTGFRHARLILAYLDTGEVIDVDESPDRG